MHERVHSTRERGGERERGCIVCKNDYERDTQRGGPREMVRERGVHRVHERVCSTRERGEREGGGGGAVDGQAGRQLADTVLVMSGVAHISDRSVAAFSPTAPAGTMSGSHACCSLGSPVRPEAGYSVGGGWCHRCPIWGGREGGMCLSSPLQMPF